MNLIVTVILLMPLFVQADKSDAVNITHETPYVDVIHKGKTVRIKRISESDNYVEPYYAITSRPCPPYCIQPIELAAGIETIGELEIIDYLKKLSAGDDNIVVIDSREAKWLNKGMIPGAINIPWTKLFNKTATPSQVREILQLSFGVAFIDGLWNFQNAKTLVFYCNGAWCGQSPTNIKSLVNYGYPVSKLKWYRGGMQSWKLFGLTTVQP